MSNRSIQARREAAVTRAAASVHPIAPVKGQGSYVWDADGRRYLDWTVGIAVMNIGHSHPRVVEAVQRQAAEFQHLCFAVGMHESYVAVAERLGRIAPGPSPKRAFLVNSGAEAVENAVKIARVATGRQGIVAFTHAFHGRTHMGLSLTGKADPYKAGFAPRAAEVYRAAYPYVYRNPFGLSGDAAADAYLSQLQDLVKTTIGETEVAAFVLEPVAGEGGFIPAPGRFLRGLRAYADTIGALWIDDEVQSGMGRTGRWWAVDHEDLEPDLVATAKSLASGFPLGAVVGRESVMNALQPGMLGTTFGGNPTACAAALATMDVIEEEGLLERAQTIGAVLRDRLASLQATTPRIGDVRGLGAMVGIEFVAEDGRSPDPATVQRVVETCRTQGLLILPTGTYGNVIRLLPPIRMSDAELDEGATTLEAAIESALREAPVAAPA
ncbi:MAG: 4-aminobutyrate--2-oxoglutarate transaminase [Nocardiopsis sp. BM-2018]|nr:MAG: 4-aminobutyrate--2-oxoglutarate transaminase [Nocardiopsis sp. BM-2018]